MSSQDRRTRPVVLVVEDEPLLLMNAVDFIEAAGFEVLEASDADSAIALLINRDDIRIVFTDIDMPGSMDGLKLAAAVRDRWPPVEIIVTSGHSNPGEDDLPIRSLFFPKPYDVGRITAAMQAFVT